jgi:hypothetical protein
MWFPDRTASGCPADSSGVDRHSKLSAFVQLNHCAGILFGRRQTASTIK